MGNEGIYSVGKDLVRQTWQISQTECFASISREDLTCETKFQAGMTLRLLVMCSTCGLFRELASHEIHLFILLNLSFHTLSHSSHTIKNTHKYREIWLNKITIKFGTKLKPTQNSYKSQLYNIPLG